MSDREDEPTDLFDAVCRLDDLADWLQESYPEEAVQVRAAADALKNYIVITVTD